MLIVYCDFNCISAAHGKLVPLIIHVSQDLGNSCHGTKSQFFNSLKYMYLLMILIVFRLSYILFGMDGTEHEARVGLSMRLGWD